MHNEKLLHALGNIGLTDNEARVYLAALAAGPSTVVRLARVASVKRTTVYSVIEALKQRGLMSVEVRGLKQRFVANDPAHLDVVLERRRTELHAILPELAALHNLKREESVIRYFEGLEAIKSIYLEMLTLVRPHEDYLVVSNLDDWLSHDEKFFMRFTEARAKLPINLRMLVMDTPRAREYKKHERNYNAHVKFLPKKTALTTNLVIIPRRVVIHQLVPPIVAITIDNPHVIRMHRESFEIMWGALP